MKRGYICILGMALMLAIQAKEVKVSSPDGKYQFTLNDENGKLHYSLNWEGKTTIHPSLLGIHANRQWRDSLILGEVTTTEQDTVWHPVYGERSVIADRYKECSVIINRRNQRDKLILDIRAYNEGVAFRYRFPGGQYLKITDELTEYVMPEGTKAYYTARAQTPYEYLPLDKWQGESERPLLLTLPDKRYVCLSEAQVVDYVRTKFAPATDKKNTIRTAMYGPVENIAPYHTPWRVIMCANQPGEILEHNDLLLNLNPSCRIKDTSWIKPGKVVREVTLTTEGGKASVDFAVKRRLQYIHFDAGWYGSEYDKASDATTVTLDPNRNPKIDALNLKEVVAYAKSKGIGVILYVNQRALQQQLDEILPLYKSWGIAGLKFGFVQVGSQVWTQWMHEAVMKCAQYGLMVDIHDEYRPTGFSRTYPNLMTQEGIRGNEEFPDATHNVTLPFTRYVAGAADYTICYYRQEFGRLQNEGDAYGVPRSRSIKTTPAHQLALSVVYYSPLQYMYWYDKPSDSQDEPELKFFDDVYTVWDDTKVLQGEVGKYITMARRHGEEWFIGSITNNDARKLKVDLSFLPEGVDYTAEIYSDGDKSIATRTKVKVSKSRVNSKSQLDFDLKASGGAAVRLVPDFVHPGLLHSQEDLNRIRSLVENEAYPSIESYRILRRMPGASFNYKVQGPFENISRAGTYGRTKKPCEDDCNAAYYNALMWIVTKDVRHAGKAMEILRAYSQTLKRIYGPDDPLCAGLQGFILVNAAEILRYTYTAAQYKNGWNETDTRTTEDMFRNVFLPVLTKFCQTPPYANGNWGIAVNKAQMAFAIFLNDRTLYNVAVDFFYHSRDNGSLPNYIADTGQIQESGRDQAHCMLGVGCLAESAECAWKQGDDLYAALDNRILKGYEYISKVNLGYKDVPFKVWKDATGKYCNWQSMGEAGLGNFRSVFEIAYNHYVYRKGLPMPYTESVVRRIRPEGAGFTCDNPGFGTLLFYLGKPESHRSEDNMINEQLTDGWKDWHISAPSLQPSATGFSLTDTGISMQKTRVRLNVAEYPYLEVRFSELPKNRKDGWLRLSYSVNSAPEFWTFHEKDAVKKTDHSFIFQLKGSRSNNRTVFTERTENVTIMLDFGKVDRVGVESIVSLREQPQSIPLDSIRLSDPSILADAKTKTYYMTGTRGLLWKSKDLHSWEGPYRVVKHDKGSWMGEKPDIWAAELHEYKGKYYYFATFTNHDLKVDTINGRALERRASHILVSNQPDGPYVPMNKDNYLPADMLTLDGTFWIEKDGKPYMIYCHEWLQNNNGTMERIELKPDLSGSVGRGKILFKASDSPWSREKINNKIQPNRVTDGPYLFRTGTGRLGMIWTSWVYNVYTQGVAYSESGTIDGPWKQEKEPITPPNFGHGMLFRTFDGKDLMSVHSHREVNGKYVRVPHLFQVDLSGDKLVVKGVYK